MPSAFTAVMLPILYHTINCWVKVMLHKPIFEPIVEMKNKMKKVKNRGKMRFYYFTLHSLNF